MNYLPPKLQSTDVATVCTEHTRRVQLLTDQFWKDDIDLWHYRRRSRELTQQFVHELTALLNRTMG